MTQRSLNGTFKLQRSLTGTGILTSVLYGANNLSDVASATQARINLGIIGQLDISSNSTQYLTASNPFGSTANEYLSINATTNASPNSLVAYDISGNITVNDITGHTFYADSVQCNGLCLSQDFQASNSVNTDKISSNLTSNVTFVSPIIANSLAVDTIATNTQSNITFNNNLNMQNLGPIYANVINSGLSYGNLYVDYICSTGQTDILMSFDGITDTNDGPIVFHTNLQWKSTGAKIIDCSNNASITFDNAGNITLFNNLSINGNSILLNASNTFYIQQQGLIAPGTQPYLTIIGSNGNIGIGKSTASYKLDVGGSIRSTGTIYTDTIQANTINGPVTIANIDSTGNFNNSAIATAGIKTNFIQNPNFTSGPGGVVYKPLLINSNIKWGATNSKIIDSNNNNTMTFDNAGNVSFYNNITVPGNLICSGIQIPSTLYTSATSPAIFSFYDSTGSNTNARTDTNGNIYGTNLYRTIWNQSINSNLSSTSLGSTFPLSQFSNTPLNMTTTTAFRLVVPFAYYGETYIFFRAFYQTFNPAPTRNIRLEIYSANNSTYSILLGSTLTNPTNNTYIEILTQLSGLTFGTIYYVAISDYSSSPSLYGFTAGDISLGNI
jgi:hypothetical protein